MLFEGFYNVLRFIIIVLDCTIITYRHIGQLWLLLAVVGITPSQGSVDQKVYYMSKMCGSKIDINHNSYAGEINFQGLWESTDDECVITVVPTHKYNRIAFQFNEAPVLKKGCIHIRERPPRGSGVGGTFCDNTPPKVGQVNVTDEWSHLIVQYKQNKQKGRLLGLSGASFNIQFNIFFTDSQCKKNYECDNGRCIPDQLNCKGHNPCGDHSDCRVIVLSSWQIAAIATGVAVLVIIWLLCMARRWCSPLKKKKLERNANREPEDRQNRNNWSEDDEHCNLHVENTRSHRNSWQAMQEGRSDVPSEPTIMLTSSAPPAQSHRYSSRSAHELNDAAMSGKHFEHTVHATGSRTDNGLNVSSERLPPPTYRDVIVREHDN